MKIEVLFDLRDYQIKYKDKIRFPDKGIPVSVIEALEQYWNKGNPFPKALRDLLFLAGESCNFLEYNFYDSQHHMQLECRDEMEDSDHLFDRPFYILEHHSCGSFLLIFLDEDQVNPMLYQFNWSKQNGLPFASPLDMSFKKFLNIEMEREIQRRMRF